MNELTTKNETSLTNQRVAWTPEQVDLIKQTVCRGATDDELKLFLYVANRTGLDPMTRQIFSVARWDNKLGRETRTMQTGIDGYRVIAERSGQYAGQVGPYWCGEDGVWVDVWLKPTPPVASKVGILRKDFKETLWAVALFKNYAPMIKNKQSGKYELSQFWAKMPDLMIAKVAEALALRKAFPQDLSGIYTKEEMEQADDHVEPQRVAPIEPKKLNQESTTQELKQNFDEAFDKKPAPIEPKKKTFEAEVVKPTKKEPKKVESSSKAMEELKKQKILEHIKDLLGEVTKKKNLTTIQQKGEFMASFLGVGKWGELSKFNEHELLEIEAKLLEMVA